MEKLRKRILYILTLVAGSQILALIFNFSLGFALLFGLAASAYYLFEKEAVSLNELIAGFTGFMISTFGLSAIGKVLILDNLCQTARSANETGAGFGVLPTEEVCRGFIENWFAVFTSNPLSNWYIWVLAVLFGALSAYIYRKRGE